MDLQLFDLCFGKVFVVAMMWISCKNGTMRFVNILFERYFRVNALCNFFSNDFGLVFSYIVDVLSN